MSARIRPEPDRDAAARRRLHRHAGWARNPSAGPGPGVPRAGRRPTSLRFPAAFRRPWSRSAPACWSAARLAERLHQPPVEPRRDPAGWRGSPSGNSAARSATASRCRWPTSPRSAGWRCPRVRRSASTPARIGEMQVHSAKAQIASSLRGSRALAGVVAANSASRCACCSACSRQRRREPVRLHPQAAPAALPRRTAGSGARGAHHRRPRAVPAAIRRQSLRARLPAPLRAAPSGRGAGRCP